MDQLRRREGHHSLARYCPLPPPPSLPHTRRLGRLRGSTGRQPGSSAGGGRGREYGQGKKGKKE